MEVTPKGRRDGEMEADGAELYLTWYFSLRSRDIFFKTRDKNLAAASSNSQRRFYHSSDFDSKTVAFSKKSVP